ncbi:phosphoribosylanthranilate isomerase [Bacillus sp. NEB1478]|uniref:phosphoribosylanthranilate isomerase n=1 Tax=Bacillus sp. NEB1478 TaxID=3073816 RepID=UPI002872D49A|nr:phosphoribosylanthranilate isomerase [Bacillus sp. NEB1478]WNB93730.1 phosphoribosylanthranilate isomerase [Bacillus sp. NEB1478]
MTFQIKYCGCQSEEDYKLLSSSKAHIIGFVFADSKRRVSTNDVSRWIELYGKQKKLAGVFQNASVETIVNAANEIPLDIIQCHGQEQPETLLQLKNKLSTDIYKAIPFNEQVFEQIKYYSSSSDAIIIDSMSEGQFGGTGIPFSWSKVPAIINEAEKLNLPVFIAGGITPSNISALLQYKPHGIDLSGGIEKDGRKCEQRITELEGMI